MDKLLLAKRVQILSSLCEDSSMRSISRVADVPINTVAKLLEDANAFMGDLASRFANRVHLTTIRTQSIP